MHLLTSPRALVVALVVGCGLGAALGAGPGAAASKTQRTTPAPATRHDTAAGPTLLVPRTQDSVVVSDPVPLTIPGRVSITDTLDVEFRRRAEEQMELGDAYGKQGLDGTAIVAYRNALRMDPSLRDANYRMGLLFLKSNQPEAALQCFSKEIEHHPDHLDAQREFGLTLARVGQGDLAVAHLTRMVEARPNDGKSWHALGYAYQAAKRPHDAERALRRSLTIPPDDAERHRDLGAVLADQGRLDEARAEYRHALAMTPNDPSTWYNLGNLDRQVGAVDSALVEYRRAQAADSLFRPAWQMEVQTLEENHRQTEATETYRRWLAQLPEDHGARMSAIRLYTDLDQPVAAMEIARQGVRDNPGDAHATEILGTTLAAQGHWREGLATMREAERLYQGDPTAMPALDAVVAHMRRVAPDSLRALFASDSVAAAARRAAAAEARKHPKPKDDLFK
jgi:tetratricopeptide (TPR) repeat protein